MEIIKKKNSPLKCKNQLLEDATIFLFVFMISCSFSRLISIALNKQHTIPTDLVPRASSGYTIPLVSILETSLNLPTTEESNKRFRGKKNVSFVYILRISLKGFFIYLLLLIHLLLFSKKWDVVNENDKKRFDCRPPGLFCLR